MWNALSSFIFYFRHEYWIVFMIIDLSLPNLIWCNLTMTLVNFNALSVLLY
jgi:hypothetical protein